MEKVTIIGAGMAGLIAGNMLRRHHVQIYEKAGHLPLNHTAVLRFRTTAVSDATGIPFSHEIVRKGLYKNGQVVNQVTIEDLNRYSIIVTGGHIYNRSIFNLKESERWCAPLDFVEQMANSVNIEFGKEFNSTDLPRTAMPIISTMPMPFAMKMFGWRDKADFIYLPVWTVKRTIAQPISAVCQTLYQTDPSSWYRATLHGQELTLEFMFEPKWDNDLTIEALYAFGIGAVNWKRDASLNKIPIGKILPIDEKNRKRFILWLTEKHGIYSLGRFACWRNILLDDIVKDVKRIEGMIEKGHTYDYH
jgi:hypothetical protein